VVALFVLGVLSCGPHTRAADSPSAPDSLWDVVVLGLIDFNMVSQFGPSPNVRYTRVLAGQVPSGGDRQLALVGMDARLLPEGGVPIYKSAREEICFLKKVVVPGNESANVYRVVDIKEATPQNLAPFPGLAR
jgi:hypothetical protein